MFQTDKPMDPILLETLKDLLQQFYWKFVWPDIVEEPKTLNLLKIDILVQESRVSNSKIDVGFLMKYNLRS